MDTKYVCLQILAKALWCYLSKLLLMISVFLFQTSFAYQICKYSSPTEKIKIFPVAAKYQKRRNEAEKRCKVHAQYSRPLSLSTVVYSRDDVRSGGRNCRHIDL